MEKFQNTFRVPTARLKNFDYGSPALYFITICTKNKEHYFGSIVETEDFPSQEKPRSEPENLPSLRETTMGKIAREYWEQIPQHFPFVELMEFIIMPNHIHGILFINKSDYEGHSVNIFGVQTKNLPSIIRGYKAGVKKFATMNSIKFLWQERYYDHIIKSPQDLENVRQYIFDNPKRWLDSSRQTH